MFSISNTLYTWHTSEGQLSVCQEENQHTLRLTQNGEVIDLTKASIEGPSFDIEPEKVRELCKHYFPVVERNQDSDTLLITFYSSTHLEQEREYEPVGRAEITKKMEGFGFSFNDLESSLTVEFSKKKQPPYRRVIRGLNFEGNCEAESCGKNICIPVGIGTFSVGEKICSFSCTACGTKLKPKNITNLGFWDCTYRIRGGQEDLEENILKKGVASREKYTTFVEGSECQWVFISIQTQRVETGADAAAPLKSGRCTLL